MMRAIVIDHYGDPSVLRLTTIPIPTPKRGEVLVKVHAIGVNPKDIVVRKGKFKRVTGSTFPKILGHDIAGEVIEANAAHDFKVGDRVYGMINDFSGRAYSEFVRIGMDQIAKIPETLSWNEAASIPLAAQTSLQALRDSGKLKAGQSVLINGASGGVGVFAIQIAKILGAHVTAISSAANHALCRELGADEVVDYKTTPAPNLEKKFNLIFDVFGNYTFDKMRHLLTERGIYVHTIPSQRIFKDAVRTCLSKQKAKLVFVVSRHRQLEWFNQQIEAGKFKTVIERVFPFEQVADAHRQIETKRTRGKIVLEL